MHSGHCWIFLDCVISNQWNKKDEIRFKKYIFLLDVFLIVGGEGSSNRNASRDESVEAGDKSVEAGDESIEAGEKTPQSWYNCILYMETTSFLYGCTGVNIFLQYCTYKGLMFIEAQMTCTATNLGENFTAYCTFTLLFSYRVTYMLIWIIIQCELYI